MIIYMYIAIYICVRCNVLFQLIPLLFHFIILLEKIFRGHVDHCALRDL